MHSSCDGCAYLNPDANEDRGGTEPFCHYGYAATRKGPGQPCSKIAVPALIDRNSVNEARADAWKAIAGRLAVRLQRHERTFSDTDRKALQAFDALKREDEKSRSS